MEDFLDSLWFKAVVLGHHVKSLLDALFAPLNSLGPAFAIFFIAFIAVVIAKFLTRTIRTKRYKELKKEFFYWYNLRQEALRVEDRDRGRMLAKNIDQAKLNKVYYDYFLETFLLSLVTKYLPIFCGMAYINEAYKPDTMMKLFGRDYIFKFGNLNGEPIFVGSVFWFIISILLIYLGWSLVGRLYKKYTIQKKAEVEGEPSSA